MWIGIWVPVPEVVQAATLWIWWNFVPAFVRRELTRLTFGPPLFRGLFNKKRGGEMKRSEMQIAEAYRVLGAVKARAPPGSPQLLLNAVDNFLWNTRGQMCVGDVKGLILDEVIARCRPKLALELGGFLGYSAVRIADCMKDFGDVKLYSMEPNPHHQDVMQQMLGHAGLSSVVQIVPGTLQSHEHELPTQPFDFIFVDHIKSAYVSDLELLVQKGFVRKGTVVVADNIWLPGVPEYRAYMRAHTKDWSTEERWSSFEYSKHIEDLVLISTYKDLSA